MSLRGEFSIQGSDARTLIIIRTVVIMIHIMIQIKSIIHCYYRLIIKPGYCNLCRTLKSEFNHKDLNTITTKG